VLSVDLGAPDGAPLATVVYFGVDHGYKFVFHGVALDNDRLPEVVQDGFRWYLCADGRPWVIPEEHAPIFHRVCLYIDDFGESVLQAPYPDDYTEIDATGRVLRALTIAVYSASIVHDSSKVFADRRWHPQLGRRDFIGGLELPHKAEEVSRARKDFTRLRQMNDRLIRGGGKKQGDGATWAGGTPDFLDDLWTTLETLIRATGTPYGHDPTSRQFRSKMREATPAANTVRTWLGKVGLLPKHIKGGIVTRANYREFIGK
jgi:hypothetical protein